MLSPLAQGSDVQSMLVQCSFAGPVSSEDSNILLLLLPRYVGSTAGFPRGAVSYLTGEGYVVSTLAPPRRWSDPKSRRTVHFLLPDMLSPHWSRLLPSPICSLCSGPLLCCPVLLRWSKLCWSRERYVASAGPLSGPGLSLTRLLPADGRIPTSQVTAQAQVGEALKATKPSTFCCSSVGQIHLAIWTNTLCNLYKYILQYILQVGQINCSDWAEVIGLRSKGGKSYCWTIHLFMIDKNVKTDAY